MPTTNSYDLNGPKQALLDTLDSAIQSHDVIVADVSIIPIVSGTLRERGKISPGEKEFVLAVYERLAGLASSGKINPYSRKEFIVYTACESFILKRSDPEFHRALLPHFRVLQSVNQTRLSDHTQHAADIFEETLKYFTKAFDVEVPRRTILKNLSHAAASALHDPRSYGIITVENSYIPLVDALFGISIEAAAKYDGTSGVRDILRTPRLSIVACDTDSGSQPFETLRDTGSEIPTHPSWLELTPQQQMAVFKNLLPLFERLVYVQSVVNFAQAIVPAEPAPDLSALCTDPPEEKYKQSPDQEKQSARLHRSRRKPEPDLETITESAQENQKSTKKPARETKSAPLSPPKYITQSSRDYLREQLGYDPEGVPLERSILKRLIELAGFKTENVAQTVREHDFYDIFEMGSSPYFRYNEKVVHKFLKKLAKKKASTPGK